MIAQPRAVLVERSEDRKNLFFLIVLLLLVVIMAARTPVDTDLWWHLRAGQATVQSGHITLTDSFSYTRAGSTWYNHSWLAQVILYLIYSAGGFPGLALLVDVLVLISLYFSWRQLEGPALLKMGIIVLVAIVASWVWSPRPQLISLALFSITGYLLYLFKFQKRDYLAWLIPLFILWSNLHAGYTLGLLLIGATLAGEIVNNIPGYPSEAKPGWKPVLKLGIIGLACGLVVAINPNGIQTWLEPFRTVQVQALQQYIAEWASPDFHDFGQQTLLWLLFSCVAAIGLSGKKIDGVDLITLILFGYLAMVARRNFGPFALAAGPILSRHAWPAISEFYAKAKKDLPGSAERIRAWMSNADREERIKPGLRKAINLTFVGLLFATGLFRIYLVSSPVLVADFIDKNYPAGAVNWIEQNHPAGQLLNSYNWGGYLVWNLRDYPVFLDGRTDLYNDEIINEWIEVTQAGEGWQEILDRWKVRLILLEPNQPIVKELARNGWVQLYQDQLSVIYGR